MNTVSPRAPAGHLRVDAGHMQNEPTVVCGRLHKDGSTSPLYHCARAKCSGKWNWDGPATEQVQCPECLAVNCLACRAIHEGLTCEAYIQYLVRSLDSGALEDSRQKKARLREQLDLYEKDMVTNSVPFTCKVCDAAVPEGDGVSLKSCHHLLCRSCLVAAIERSGTVAVKCPFIGNDVTCVMDLQDSEIRALLSKEEYDEFLEKGLTEVKVAVKNFFHCRTPDCPWWCLVEGGVVEVECKVCGRTSCARCDAMHTGVTCTEYQAWRASKMQVVLAKEPEDNLDLFMSCCLHIAWMAGIIYLLVKCVMPSLS
ncbi:unnamed protein product [Ixodes persulcatus]